MLPLRGYVMFPGAALTLDVGRPKSVRAVEQAMLDGGYLYMSAQKDANLEEPGWEDVFDIGSVAQVRQVTHLPGGAIRILVEGVNRARMLTLIGGEDFLRARVNPMPEEVGDMVRTEALLRVLLESLEEYAKQEQALPAEALAALTRIEIPGRLCDMIAMQLNISIEDKQLVLATINHVERMEKVIEILRREIDIQGVKRDINARVRTQMEKNQREYYLREQLKAIQAELGYGEARGAEVDRLHEKAEKTDLPDAVRERVNRELDRLASMPPGVAEAVVVENYVDWLLALPWLVKTDDSLDIKKAEEILEAEHYGLKKVKTRILEFLAVRKLTQQLKGPILCLVGPPGVGKTSLAQSVARAMNRKFVRISLGGVRDEAEIRGHRRTYVGALPGRIVQGIRQAGSANPVFLLDEIDKLSSDFHGDPASALLEVLDPEQNYTFADHYIELPFDLSGVLFITTANAQHTIPRPLLDRMEVLYIEGYTDDEKVEIARRHLLPKQLNTHGLSDQMMTISEGALAGLIAGYTREAGVRSLERELGSLCRKAARQIAAGERGVVNITSQNLKSYLGPEKFHHALSEEKDQVGVATGLAWTEVGGETMGIEVAVMPGKGNLTLTGQLGDVMRESAQAAYTYVRSRARDLGMDTEFYHNNDIHIHIPEGAIPKDGPSAGITLATALASALSGRPVRKDVAMTGEITLTGRVLPIGGLKEKSLAAYRAGIRTVLVPKQNEADLEEIPSTIRRHLHFELVENMDEVLARALGEKANLENPECRTGDDRGVQVPVSQ
jgi:ATP-dependent Lon protease